MVMFKNLDEIRKYGKSMGWWTILTFKFSSILESRENL